MTEIGKVRHVERSMVLEDHHALMHGAGPQHPQIGNPSPADAHVV